MHDKFDIYEIADKLIKAKRISESYILVRNGSKKLKIAIFITYFIKLIKMLIKKLTKEPNVSKAASYI